jgi:predicted O-linked N-acetylglucosamine transferase (SPINDLY family)
MSHDPAPFDIFYYSDVLHEDAFTGRFRRHGGHWRKIAGLRDGQVAELVREDSIDILVDLAGHTAQNRLLVFARKPAPVQVTWLGYCTTTGMMAMDYRLTDACADPPGASEHLHVEQLVRLPEVFACFRPWEDSPPVSALPATSARHVTFGSFHTLAKLNAPLLECWARILLLVPDSRLLIACTGLTESSQRRRLADFFAGKGIGSARLDFRGRQSLADYLALHHSVDVLLDSHPFTAHTVSCHALWMGVPVVTLAGSTHCSRMVASVLRALGLHEWIARTPDQYVRIACEQATDLRRLAQLRASLRPRMATSPLTDARRFARNVEAAFRQMWGKWCMEAI